MKSITVPPAAEFLPAIWAPVLAEELTRWLGVEITAEQVLADIRAGNAWWECESEC